MADDLLTIAGTAFSSRLIMGTGAPPAWRSWSARCSPPAPS